MPKDHEHLRASLEAAARGDARAAWERLRAGPVVEESITRFQLDQLVTLGDAAPRWVYSRWCAQQAYHWMLIELDPRIDRAVIETIAAAYWPQVQEPAGTRGFGEFGTRVAACDWVCQQLAVFDHGGLTDFLDLRAEPALLDRCDRIRGWADAPMGGYVLEGHAGDALRVRDLTGGHVLDLLDLGALRDRAPGTPVLGRVVPVDVPPGRMFESRPETVDLVTAREAARRTSDSDPLGWLVAVERGREQGRLPAGFSCGHATLFADDVVAARPGAG